MCISFFWQQILSGTHISQFLTICRPSYPTFTDYPTHFYSVSSYHWPGSGKHCAPHIQGHPLRATTGAFVGGPPPFSRGSRMPLTVIPGTYGGKRPWTDHYRLWFGWPWKIRNCVLGNALWNRINKSAYQHHGVPKDTHATLHAMNIS